MARDWIEFVQTQNIPWSPHDLWGLRPGVEVRVLSMDPETGACSLMVRYPAGFAAEGGALTADEEFLVLSGSLALGDTGYGDRAYAHLPAGFLAGDLTSERGATVLTFFSARPARTDTPANYDPARLVEHLDSYAVPYTGNFHPEFPPGAGRKVLFTDPHTHETSWILGTLPMRWAERAEKHPVVEEMYLLSGEVHGDRGVMRPGAYFWRPGGIAHGPYGTLTGNLYFFRTQGGGLTTEYEAPAKPFRWWPEHAPQLPNSLKPYGGEAPPPPPPW
jgi:hypothetical protein